MDKYVGQYRLIGHVKDSHPHFLFMVLNVLSNHHIASTVIGAKYFVLKVGQCISVRASGF